MLMLRSATAAAPKSSGRPSEDAYIDSDDWIGVADGVGAWATEGINSGLFAQGLLTWCIELLHQSAGRKDGRSMLGVIAEATERTKPIGSSTIVLAGGLEDGKNILHIANMGDSGCLVIRGGRLLVRTTVQQAGPNFPYQVCNSKSPKDKECAMDPVELGEVLKIPVCCGDIIICATDGILDCLTVEKLVAVSADIIRTGGTPENLAKVLLYLALCGCKDDDKTVVVSLVLDKVDEGGMKRETLEPFWTDKVIQLVPSMISSWESHQSRYYIGSALGKLLSVTGVPLRMKYFEEDLNGLRGLVGFRAKPKQVVDWDMVLQLPSGVKEVLDDYACGKLGLASYKDTGLVSCDGIPCLLLSHLGKDKDEGSSTCGRLKEAVQASRMLMLGGGRGSGKTRCLFTYFSTEERGLYFAAAPEDGQGSLDLDFLIKEVLSRFVRKEKKPSGYATVDTLWNSREVSFFVSLLLGVRMKIYEYCKDKMGNKEWLLLQAACRRLVYSNGTLVGAAGDVFRDLLVSVCQSIDWNLLDRPDRIPLPKNLPTCAIDNIQDCWGCLQGCFADETGENLGGLGYSLGICFQDLGSPVIFCGAADDEKLLVGPPRRYSGKPPLKVKMVYLEEGDGWKEPEEVIKFGEQVLGRAMSGAEAELVRTDVYERFKCRFRFTPYITMLEVMLARGLSLQEAAEYVEKGYTTQEGVKEVKESLYKSVSTCSRPCQAVLNLLSLKRTVLGKESSVVIKKDVYRMDAYRELLELGLARLDNKKHLAIVDEYLVWKAHENKHGLVMSAEWVRDLPKVIGRNDEDLLNCYDWLPLCFLRMWSQYEGVLRDMPVFKEVLQAAEFPTQLARGVSMFWKGSGASPVLPLTQQRQLVDFLAGDGADCTMLQWGANDFTSGSGAGRIVCDNGQLVGFLYQQHYPDHYVDSCSGEIVTGSVVLDSVDWKKLVQVAELDVYLCVVLVHPYQSIKGQPRWTVEELVPGKIKITLLLDMENMALAITEAEMELLKTTCFQRSYQQKHYKKQIGPLYTTH